MSQHLEEFTSRRRRDSAQQGDESTSAVTQRLLSAAGPVTRPYKRAESACAWFDWSAVELVAGGLVESAEPAVVFASLAAATVPVLAGACSITIVDDDGAAYQLHYPREEHNRSGPASYDDDRSDAQERASRSTDSTVIAVRAAEGACAGEPGYQVAVRYAVTVLPDAAQADLAAPAIRVVASMLTRRAADVVRQARLAAACDAADTKAANLTTALESSREIGQAIGILMSSHHLTAQQGFDLLRGVSQQTHRKLRDIAEDVTQTGTLEIPDKTAVRRLRLVDDVAETNDMNGSKDVGGLTSSRGRS